MAKNLFYLIFFILPYTVSSQPITKTVNPKTGFLEIRNGLCGVVIPWKKAILTKQYDLAPIQSFIYKDDKHSDTSINYLQAGTKPYSFSASILNESLSEITVQLKYLFNKPKFSFEGLSYKGGEAGPGYYSAIITIRSGRKSITIEEDSNYDIGYLVDINNGLWADKGRYRGYSSDSPKNGYEPDGKIYRAEHDRRYGLDATVDLDFSVEKYMSWLPTWEPAGGEVNTGRYWQFFNSSGSIASNILGYFQGKPSKLLEGKFVGPGIKISKDKNENRIELAQAINRRGPDNSWYPHKRFQWNVFISTKQDVLSAEKTQPIGIELNMLSGLASKINGFTKYSNHIVSSFYDGAIYLDKAAMQSLISKVKTDQKYFNYLVSIDDGLGYPMLESWRDTAKAQKNIRELIDFKEYLIKEYINGDGSFSLELRYWKGVRTFKGKALLISGLFADKTIKMNKREKAELESLVGLMARILWDNDNVPVIDSAGVNMGSANMVHQYVQGGRIFFALIMAYDPEFKTRVKSIVADTKKEIKSILYANGASFGTPHYIQPAIDPVLFLMLQIKQAGLENLFSESLIKKFSYFYAGLFTPASVRFGNNRKIISFGDGSEESTPTIGLLAEGFKSIDRALSKKLYTLYFNGPPRSSFAGPLMLAVNLLPPDSMPFNWTSCSYDGYYSNIRFAANTPIESSLWTINGNKYFDHCNDDAGETAIYALGAPLSLSRSSFYYPRADAAHIRNMVIPSALFKEWSSADQPINGKAYTWNKTKLNEYAALKSFTSYSITSVLDSLKWFRQVISIITPDSIPIIIFKDSLSNNTESISSLPMMSMGSIKSMVGDLNPICKKYFNGQSSELPTGTGNVGLPAGWNTFKCTGQQWPLHISKGIDWDIYTFNKNPIEISTACWATNWQNSTEQSEFQVSNGRPYEESQQYLRIKSKGALYTIIIPRLKNAKPLSIRYEQLSNILMVSNGKYTMKITSEGFDLKDPGTSLTRYGVFESGKQYIDGNTMVAGGPMELEIKANVVSCMIAGNTGRRSIKLNGKLIGLNAGGPSISTSSNKVSTVIFNQTVSTLDVPNESLGYKTFSFKIN